MFSLLKWYALTIGAWKRYRRWKLHVKLFKANTLAEIDALVKDFKRDLNRQLYEQPPILMKGLETIHDTMCVSHKDRVDG